MQPASRAMFAAELRICLHRVTHAKIRFVVREAGRFETPGGRQVDIAAAMATSAMTCVPTAASEISVDGATLSNVYDR